MRGALVSVIAHQELRRIIPADAGSTRNVPHPSLWYKDHPRGCGEHEHLPHFAMRADGSSPRMRGALFQGGTLKIRQGIIPADAGSTIVTDLHGRDAWDHPRGCGEHFGPEPGAG